MDMTFNFGGKTALVTGGGSGIGKAAAQAFARAGAHIAVADVDRDAGESLARTIRDSGGSATFFHVDVADEAAIRSMINAVVKTCGGLDMALNNAGIEGKTVPMCDLPSDTWRKVMDVDLSSVFYCMKAEIEQMVRSGRAGAIVNTASASGLIGGYNLSAYTAAKHGVVGLTRAAAADYGPHGIRINALCPGLVDTPFIADSRRVDLRRAAQPPWYTRGDGPRRLVALLRRRNLCHRPRAVGRWRGRLDQRQHPPPGSGVIGQRPVRLRQQARGQAVPPGEARHRMNLRSEETPRTSIWTILTKSKGCSETVEYSSMSRPRSYSPAAGLHRLKSSAEEKLERLTEHENTILLLVYEGTSKGEILGVLDISSLTLEAHKSRLMSKLEVNRTAHAVRIAFYAGLGAKAKRK